MREVKDKNNWALFSFLLVVVIIAAGYFLINPFINDIKALNEKVDAKDIENKELEDKLTSLQILKKQFAENTDATKMLDLALPESDMLAEVIETIRDTADDSVVQITSIKQNQTKDSESTDIVVAFEASYTSFKMFLEDLEQNVRLVTPTKITLNETQNADGGEAFLKGSMTLSFFKVASSTSTSSSDSQTQNDTNTNNTNQGE